MSGIPPGDEIPRSTSQFLIFPLEVDAELMTSTSEANSDTNRRLKEIGGGGGGDPLKGNEELVTSKRKKACILDKEEEEEEAAAVSCR